MSEDGKTIIYGLYPQTHVNNDELILSLNSLVAESNGWYWTRSPSSESPNQAWFIDNDGHLYSTFTDIDGPFLGVRPAMTISLIN